VRSPRDSDRHRETRRERIEALLGVYAICMIAMAISRNHHSEFRPKPATRMQDSIALQSRITPGRSPSPG